MVNAHLCASLSFLSTFLIFPQVIFHADSRKSFWQPLTAICRPPTVVKWRHFLFYNIPRQTVSLKAVLWGGLMYQTTSSSLATEFAIKIYSSKDHSVSLQISHVQGLWRHCSTDPHSPRQETPYFRRNRHTWYNSEWISWVKIIKSG